MRTLVNHARRRTPFGTITILRDKLDGTLRYSQGNVYQSVADRNGVSLSVYIHAIYGLVAPLSAQRTLIIGCAGGSLGAMLSHVHRQVTMVDINPEAFALAHRFFSLPESVKCVAEDGVQFLRKCIINYDSIVVDVHDGMELPRAFSQSGFFRLALKRLRARGYLLVNIILRDDSDPAARAIAKLLQRQVRSVQILDTPGERGRNAIVIAGPAPLPRPSQLLVLPETQRAELAAELRAMQLIHWQTA